MAWEIFAGESPEPAVGPPVHVLMDDLIKATVSSATDGGELEDVLIVKRADICHVSKS